MVDFSSLLNAKAGEALKPKALPPGLYPGVIKARQLLEAPAGKEYTIIIRFDLGLTGWPDEIEESERLQETKPGEFAPIDLSKKRLRRDYYNHRLFDLDDLIKALGVDPAGRTYDELLPELVGQPVLVEVAQYLSRDGELQNQVNNLLAAG